MADAGPPRKRIFFTTTGWLGGAERSMLELAGALAARGSAVHGLFPPGELSRSWTAAGLTCEPVSMPPITRKILQNPFAMPNVAGDTIKAFEQLAQKLIAAAPPPAAPVTLCANSIPAVLYAGLLTKLVPRVQPALAGIVWHCRDLPERAQIGTSFAAAVFPTLRRALAISDTVARSLLAVGLPPEKLTVIRNGIGLPAAVKNARTPVQQRAARGSFGLQLDRPTVLQIAQFTPWKKTPLFLEACRVAGIQRPLQVLLVGREPGADADELPMTLKLTLDRLRAAHIPVVHRGSLDAAGLELAYAAADLLVHTAVQEPFGRVVLEAMARGLPVLCRGAEGGGPAELIRHEQTGWKVDHDDGFAPAIVELLSDESRLATLGAAARTEAHRIDPATGLPIHGTDRVAAEFSALLEAQGL